MKELQEALDRTIAELPDKLLAEMLEKRLLEAGVKLSDRARKSIVERMLANDGAVVYEPWKWWDRKCIDLELTDEDLTELEGRIAKIEQAIPEIVERVTDRLATEMVQGLKDRWPKESRAQRKQLMGFRERLHERWSTPLELLRMLLTMCLELGGDINKELTRSPEFATRPHLVDVLRRSHARACQITDEVLTLLEGGFADGAMARWRTLHEVTVTASLVAERGEDLAERYVRHQAVESKRAADEYQRCVPELGYEPIEAAEMAKIQEEFNQVVARYGGDFGKGQYGWAAHHLSIRKPTFAEIERAAQVGHMRAHYRMASHNVHANPKGTFWKLGLMPETPFLLAGPSNSGLSEPGQNAAWSLAQLTAIFGSLHPSLDNNVVVRAITRLTDEVAEGFAGAHRRLVEDEEALRSAEKK